MPIVDGISGYLTSQEAAEALGVKRATLYTYVSRGQIRIIPAANGKRRLYLASDIERMRQRSDAHKGEAAVAATALRWGEPVVDSTITLIDADGPNYRGIPSLTLAERGESLESVAELLWTGTLPIEAPRWPPCAPGLHLDEVARLVRADVGPLTALAVWIPLLAASDPLRFGAPNAAELNRGRSLIRRLAAGVALASEVADRAARIEGALACDTVAETFARAVGSPPRSAEHIDLALVVCADHELNASTFAARIAASAGADLYACVGAGLATLSGPRHGGLSDRVEAFIREVGTPDRAPAAIGARMRRGEDIPGFGHRLYPQGDPRAETLLARAFEVGAGQPQVETVRAVVDAMATAGHPAPNLDVGLVAISAALKLPQGTSPALFAIGRCAGWIAHILEQRKQGYLLRPRAQYVGD